MSAQDKNNLKVQNADSNIKKKSFSLTLFKKERTIGTFAGVLHSDIRHCFDMVRRGRQPTISKERVEMVLKALSGHTQIKSLEDMEKLVAEWKAEYNASWDADDYYNGHRVGQYTEWNRVPQFRLTSMAYALSGLERQQDSCFVLDIACGSGLSSSVLKDHGHFVIGTDLSSAMLLQHKGADDVLLIDMSQPLPFREGVLDAAFSISAIHYLTRGEQTASTRRINDFFTSLQRCIGDMGTQTMRSNDATQTTNRGTKRHLSDVSDTVYKIETTSIELDGNSTGESRPSFVAQFYPERSGDDDLLLQAAYSHGFVAFLIADNIHQTAAIRLFIVLIKRHEKELSRPVCPLYTKEKASCILAYNAWTKEHNIRCPLLPGEHSKWVANQHAIYARKLVRNLRRINAVASESVTSTSLAPSKKIGGKETVPSMTEHESVLAAKLTEEFRLEVTLDEMKAKIDTVLHILHSS